MCGGLIETATKKKKTKQLLFYVAYKGNPCCASLQLLLGALLWSEIAVTLFIELFVRIYLGGLSQRAYAGS